jgi:hypothetical protein
MTVPSKQNPINKFLHFIPIHPFILAIYPIVGLMAINVREIYTRDAIVPILIALLLTAVILGALKVLSRNWHIAGLLTSLLVIWFFTYGHLYNQVKNLSILGLIVGRHRYLIVIWTVFILASMFWLLKRNKSAPNLTFALNIISGLLICIPIAQIGAYHVQNLMASKTPLVASDNSLISWTRPSPQPDIYFIVLDGYGRSDALQAVEGIDNSAFINSLHQLGFYVAKCSQSNYTRTLLSLSAIFNMEYIQTINPHLTPDQSTTWLFPYLKHSLVRQQLEQLGYQTIVFQNPWESMVWEDADIVYKHGGSVLLSPFEYLVLDTTVTRIYLDAEQAKSNQMAHYSNYMDTRYALDKLQDVPGIPGPKLVFAHLVIPHAPFVFGPDGEYIDIQPYDTVNNLYTDEDYQRGYTAAVTYINKRMLEIIPTLIESSKTPPIIILIGDHGIGDSSTVNQNLEAFFVPGSQSGFYATITPVNIFRLIFDDYFNGDFGLLPDESYYSAEGQYFNFREIPNQCSTP